MASTPQRPRFHVMTIFTEGAPHDDGVALADVAREFRELVPTNLVAPEWDEILVAT